MCQLHLNKIERELKPGLWNNLEGWDGEGGGRGGGGCGWGAGGDIGIYLWLIDVDVWQTPTQYCKAIILQFKINAFNYF